MTPHFFYISDITNSSSFNGKICRKKSMLENFGANVLKPTDLPVLFYHNAQFVYQFLLKSFRSFFQSVSYVHKYKTRFAMRSTYYINNVRNNYGKFNIRYAAVAAWNDLDENTKQLTPKLFKEQLKLNLIQGYS